MKVKLKEKAARYDKETKKGVKSMSVPIIIEIAACRLGEDYSVKGISYAKPF